MLVPLFEDADGTVQVVLTQRSLTLSSHGGARSSECWASRIAWDLSYLDRPQVADDRTWPLTLVVSGHE